MLALPLRSSPYYRRLYVANLLSAFGTQATAVGLPLLVLAEFRQAFYLGLIGLAEALTAICVFPFAGLLIDRIAVRTILVVCDVGRAITVGLIAILLATGHLSIVTLIVLTIIIIALGVPFQPAVLMALRTVIPAEQLPTALAQTQTRVAVAGIAGPFVGGALFALSPVAPLLLDAASFAISSILIVSLRLRAVAVPAQPGRGASTLSLRDLAAGVVYLISNRSARYVSVMVIVIDFVVAGVFLSLVATMSAGADSIGTGALFAATSVGNLVGSVIVLPVLRILGFRRAVVALSSVLATLIVGLSCTTDPVWRVALIGCCCVFTPLFSVVAQRTLLLGTPASVAGRVQVGFSLLPQVVVPLGPLISTALLSQFGLATVIRLFATVLVGFALASSVCRMARAIPEAAAEQTVPSTDPVADSGRPPALEAKDV